MISFRIAGTRRTARLQGARVPLWAVLVCLLFFLLSCLLSGGCSSPPKVAPRPAPPRAQIKEPLVSEKILEAYREFQRKDLDGARSRCGRMLMAHPDSLEAWVLLAVILEAQGEAEAVVETWEKVERILVYAGKLEPFLIQQLLYSATEHYAKIKNYKRSQIFLNELWRRFPDSEWSVKTQLMLAAMEFKREQWSLVIKACQVLLRIRSGHSSAGECRRMIRASTRMLEVGPQPAPDATSWRWEHPWPQGNSLHDVWVSKRGEVFVVGEAGTILHRRPGGRTFERVRSPTRWSLRRLTGTARDNLFAVGAAGVILHYNGKAWRVIREYAPAQEDLWGAFTTGREQVIAVGDAGTVVRRQGEKWETTQIPEVQLRSIWGASDGALYAVGLGGVLLKIEEGRWKTLNSDCYEDLWSIWGGQPKQIFAVGNRKTIVSFDGVRAKESVVGRAHFRDVAGDGTAQAWAVGTGGDIVHYRHRKWRSERSGTFMNLYGVAVGSSQQVWAVGGGGTIVRRRGGRWTLMAGGVHQKLVGIAPGPTKGTGIALGDQGLLLTRNRGRWLAAPSLPHGRYRGLWSTGSQVFAIGDRGLLIQQEKRGWKRITTNTSEDLRGIWGWGEDLVVVGTRGTILRLIKGKLVRDTSPSGLDLHGVWGTSHRSMVAVGNRGLILKFDGEGWIEQESGSLSDLYGVWQGSPQQIIAVGKGGTILRLERGRWRSASSPLSQDLITVWGSPQRGVFAISDRGGIIRFNGSSWRVQNSPTHCLSALHGSPELGVLAAGCHGTILRLEEP